MQLSLELLRLKSWGCLEQVAAADVMRNVRVCISHVGSPAPGILGVEKLSPLAARIQELESFQLKGPCPEELRVW